MALTFSEKLDKLWHSGSLKLNTQNFRKKLDKLIDTFIRLELTVLHCITTQNNVVLILQDGYPGVAKNEQEGTETFLTHFH